MYPVEIVTPSVTLREFTLEDLSDVFAYASDAEGSAFMSWPVSKVPEDSLPFLTEAVESGRMVERVRYELAIELEGSVVGGCSLRIVPARPHEAEMGYIIRRELWGQGLMTHIAAHLVHFGFDELQLRRIGAFHDVDNVGSQRVMEKLGMKYEGRLRDHLVNRAGEYRDSDLRAILVTDPRPDIGI